ncbi:hypothetical protein [Hahella ganghwensis]|uniref:hypothetical protein n=1 Tax=Hahella ganghwensis TaxID=286420 RepID=UPI000360E593|nr:hypothetical protein [Hahella ganghwensis]
MTETSNYLDSYPIVFFLMVVLILVWNLASFYFSNRRIKAMFNNLDLSQAKFRELHVSGYSKKNILSKLKQGRGFVDVIVTEKELCIRNTNSPFTFSVTRFDLIRRVKLSDVRRVEFIGEGTKISFANDADIVLRLQNPAAFAMAVAG